MKKSVKIVLIILAIPVLLLGVFFGWTYINYLRDTDKDKAFLYPTIQSSRIEVSLLTQEKSDLIVNLLMVNHLPLPIRGKNVEYSFFMDGVKIMQSQYEKSIALKGSDSSWISLPMSVFSKDFKSVIDKNEKSKTDSVEYEFRVSFQTDYFIKKNITLNYKEILPLYYFPEVTARHLEIDSLNPVRAAAEIVVLIENKNSFPIKSTDAAYRFSIEGHEWIEGKIPGLTDIKARSVTELRIPIRISFKEMSKTVFDLLKHGNHLNYKFNLSFTMRSKTKMLSDSKISVERSGTIKSLMKSREI